jgi:hypothetical protein
MRYKILLGALASLAMVIACSSSGEPGASLELARTYHLRSIDGVSLPISDPSGDILDSGHVIRLGGDTVRVDHYSHLPASGRGPLTGTISLGTWVASQSGDVVVLFPAIASSRDTAFLGHGDTLTLHAHSSGVLRVEVYVAP